MGRSVVRYLVNGAAQARMGEAESDGPASTVGTRNALWDEMMRSAYLAEDSDIEFRQAALPGESNLGRGTDAHGHAAGRQRRRH